MKALICIFTVLIGIPSAFANRESGGRGKGEGKPDRIAVPALSCHLRQPSRQAFVISTSKSDRNYRSNASVYGSSADDTLKRVAQHRGVWSREAGKTIVLIGHSFVLRIFSFTANKGADFYASYESPEESVKLLYCNQTR